MTTSETSMFIMAALYCASFGNNLSRLLEKKELRNKHHKGSFIDWRSIFLIIEEITCTQGDGTCPTPGCDGSGHASGQWKTHYTYVYLLPMLFEWLM